MKKDIFDTLEIDALDMAELSPEDKVLFSKELAAKIREEIAKIPMGKIITSILEKEMANHLKETDQIKASFQKDIERVKSEAKAESKKDLDAFLEFKDKTSKNFEKLANQFLSFSKERWHQFGGFSPQVNDLNIGDPASNGSWRIVKSGDNLSVQKLVAGTWTETFAFTPNA